MLISVPLLLIFPYVINSTQWQPQHDCMYNEFAEITSPKLFNIHWNTSETSEQRVRIGKKKPLARSHTHRERKFNHRLYGC